MKIFSCLVIILSIILCSGYSVIAQAADGSIYRHSEEDRDKQMDIQCNNPECKSCQVYGVKDTTVEFNMEKLLKPEPIGKFKSGKYYIVYAIDPRYAQGDMWKINQEPLPAKKWRSYGPTQIDGGREYTLEFNGGICIRFVPSGYHSDSSSGTVKVVNMDTNDKNPYSFCFVPSATGVTSDMHNLVSNGDFETPVIAGQWTGYGQGESMGAWSVSSGSIDIVSSSGWPSESGKQSLDLAGSESGSISQTISTTPGQEYVLTFYLSGNPGSSTTKSIDVYWDGNKIGSYSAEQIGSFSDMKWKKITVKDIVAKGTKTDLRFTDSSASGGWGAAIDYVVVN